VVIAFQGSVTARSKCCNLVGNLCRYSSRFYPVLRFVAYRPASPRGYVTTENGPETMSSNEDMPVTLLRLLIACCEDPEPAIRKFACFSVGNASFHSSELYPELIPSINKLASCFEDYDSKTRFERYFLVSVRTGALTLFLAGQMPLVRLGILSAMEAI
jgi:fused-like protein